MIDLALASVSVVLTLIAVQIARRAERDRRADELQRDPDWPARARRRVQWSTALTVATCAIAVVLLVRLALHWV